MMGLPHCGFLATTMVVRIVSPRHPPLDPPQHLQPLRRLVCRLPMPTARQPRRLRAVGERERPPILNTCFDLSCNSITNLTITPPKGHSANSLLEEEMPRIALKLILLSRNQERQGKRPNPSTMASYHVQRLTLHHSRKRRRIPVHEVLPARTLLSPPRPARVPEKGPRHRNRMIPTKKMVGEAAAPRAVAPKAAMPRRRRPTTLGDNKNLARLLPCAARRILDPPRNRTVVDRPIMGKR
jgi:hypothetical protein